MEDFSLIILCKRQIHLLPLTLDTLKAQKGAFEVLMLGNMKGDLAKQYPELNLRTSKGIGNTLGELMNEAVSIAKGKYIQFLEPGDRYISQQGLEYLKTLIEDEPHLIYANSLFKGGMFYANTMNARSFWLLKTKFFELGGFDSRLNHPTIDFLCRLMRDQTAKSIFCKRVLIDSALPDFAPIRETCRVLYRHFGARFVVKWLLFNERFFSRALAFLKDAFWRGAE